MPHYQIRNDLEDESEPVAMRFNQLLAVLSPESIAEISRQVASAWSQHKSLLPMFLRKELPDTMPETWAQEKILTLTKCYLAIPRTQDVSPDKKEKPL